MTNSNASIKVWGCPELVENIFLFLDIRSIASLAAAHEPVLKVLKNKSVWNKLIRQTCPTGHKTKEKENSGYTTEEFAVMLTNSKRKVEGFANILKTFDDPKSHLLDLLDFISENFPPFEIAPNRIGSLEKMKNAVAVYEGAVANNSVPGSEFFQLTSSRHGPLAVSPLGYLLLEALEGALGTTEQKVEWVVFDYFAGPWLKAFASRLSRQQGVQVKVDLMRAGLETRKRTEALLFIMQNCQSMNIQGHLYISSYIGTEGWIAVRKVVANTEVKHLECCKKHLVEARRVDLKAICKGLTETFSVELKDFWYTYEKQDGKDLWRQLEQLLESEEEEDQESSSEDDQTSGDEDTAPGSTTEEEEASEVEVETY